MASQYKQLAGTGSMAPGGIIVTRGMQTIGLIAFPLSAILMKSLNHIEQLHIGDHHDAFIGLSNSTSVVVFAADPGVPPEVVLPLFETVGRVRTISVLPPDRVGRLYKRRSFCQSANVAMVHDSSM